MPVQDHHITPRTKSSNVQQERMSTRQSRSRKQAAPIHLAETPLGAHKPTPNPPAPLTSSALLVVKVAMSMVTMAPLSA